MILEFEYTVIADICLLPVVPAECVGAMFLRRLLRFFSDFCMVGLDKGKTCDNIQSSGEKIGRFQKPCKFSCEY